MPSRAADQHRHLPGVEAEADVQQAEENNRGKSQLVLMFFHEIH